MIGNRRVLGVSIELETVDKYQSLVPARVSRHSHFQQLSPFQTQSGNQASNFITKRLSEAVFGLRTPLGTVVAVHEVTKLTVLLIDISQGFRATPGTNG